MLDAPADGAGRAARRVDAAMLVRGDIRALPFRDRAFSMVIAPYGILQSLLADRDLVATLSSVARVLTPGGRFGIDLVPDVPQWREYENKTQLRGRTASGAHLTLIESVRQDRPAASHDLSISDTSSSAASGRHEHCFELTFRTLSVRQMTRRLETAGFDGRGGAGRLPGPAPGTSEPTSGSCSPAVDRRKLSHRPVVLEQCSRAAVGTIARRGM